MPSNRKIVADLNEYCTLYNVPLEQLINILEDQKVLPMIRGKAVEFMGAKTLEKTLAREWSVINLNLNPAPGTDDEDISITYLRTGQRFRTETKSATRGSFKLKGNNCKQPHFTVKCNKSRKTYDQKRGFTHDHFEASKFDLLMCNLSNALFRGKETARGLHFIKAPEALEWLKEFYKVNTDEELRAKAYGDWRICFPGDIALDNGLLPKAPIVQIENDPYWFGIEQLKNQLLSKI